MGRAGSFFLAVVIADLWLSAGLARPCSSAVAQLQSRMAPLRVYFRASDFGLEALRAGEAEGYFAFSEFELAGERFFVFWDHSTLKHPDHRAVRDLILASAPDARLIMGGLFFGVFENSSEQKVKLRLLNLGRSPSVLFELLEPSPEDLGRLLADLRQDESLDLESQKKFEIVWHGFASVVDQKSNRASPPKVSIQEIEEKLQRARPPPSP